jgi:nucleotide-binding universal stress UspA family protein
MYKHVLIASDGSEFAENAVAQGLMLAKQLNARVTAVTVTEPLPSILAAEATSKFPLEFYASAAKSNAEDILSHIKERAHQAGVKCETAHVADHFPAEGIIEAAESRECDLIVMAPHGRRGIAKLLLGSQTMRVLSSSSRPVLVCR